MNKRQLKKKRLKNPTLKLQHEIKKGFRKKLSWAMRSHGVNRFGHE